MPSRKPSTGTRKQTAEAKEPKRKASSSKRSARTSTGTTTITNAAAAEEGRRRSKRARQEEDEPGLGAGEADEKPKRARRNQGGRGRGRPSTATSTAAAAATATAPSRPPVLNARPTQALDVFVFGDGSFGELGLGNKRKKIGGAPPTEVKRPRLNHKLAAREVGVVQLACGGMHAVALTRDGRVLTWGVNDERALGRDTSWEGEAEDDDDEEGLDPGESTPMEVDLSALGDGCHIAQVAATNSASFVLTDIGTVYGWGTFRNLNGVLGFSQTASIQATPAPVPGLSRIASLASGANHMLALDHDGRVFTWGAGDNSQLGRRVLAPRRRSPGSSGELASLAPRACARFSRTHRAVAVAAGAYHSFYVDGRGRLWSWGLNNFAQTGHAEGAGGAGAAVAAPRAVAALRGREVRRVGAGEHHSVACDAAGETLVWGRADSHRLGLGAEALTGEKGTVFDGRGRPRMLVTPTVVPGLEAICVASCSSTTIAVTPAGEAYSWGFSENLQTGLGTTEDVEVPTKIEAPALVGKRLIWAGIGGQYGMVAAPSGIEVRSGARGPG